MSDPIDRLYTEIAKAAGKGMSDAIDELYSAIEKAKRVTGGHSGSAFNRHGNKVRVFVPDNDKKAALLRWAKRRDRADPPSKYSRFSPKK